MLAKAGPHSDAAVSAGDNSKIERQNQVNLFYLFKIVFGFYDSCWCKELRRENKREF